MKTSILCPVDFSILSDHAVAAAAKIAQKCGAQLDLFNVQSSRSLVPSETVLGSNRKQTATFNRLEELSSEVSRVYKITCYANVQTSNRSLPQVISEVGNNYDLVVMGTNGEDQVYDTIFGTNSYQVAKESSSPVLLLPPRYEYQNFSSVIFALDYFHELKSPSKQLIKWADLLDARITLLQIMTGEYRHLDEDQLRRAQQIIKRLLEKKHHNFQTLYSDRPIEGIVDFISVNECDALALCFRHHTLMEKLFHKNVVKDLCALTPCPLFLFHL